jgi:hypothetical protein
VARLGPGCSAYQSGSLLLIDISCMLEQAERISGLSTSRK